MRKSNIEFEYCRINGEQHLCNSDEEGKKDITISKLYNQVSEGRDEEHEWNGMYHIINYEDITGIICYIDFIEGKPCIEFISGDSFRNCYPGATLPNDLDYENKYDREIIDKIMNRVIKCDEFISFCKTIDKMNKLEEKLSLESTGEESKLKFFEYIVGKVEPLGKVMLNEDDELVTNEKEEHSDYDVIMEGRIRNYGLCKILDNSINGGNSLLFVTEENNILDIPMIDATIYTARLEFEKIDPTYAQLVLKYWDESQMGYLIEEQTEENELENSLIL